MKIIVAKSDLLILISKIQNLVPVKPAIPVLSNILIEACDDQIIISATDLTTSLKSFSSAKVMEPGAVLVPGKKFIQLIRELTSPQITLISDAQETLEILSGSSTFKIHTLPKNEFPKLPELTGAKELILQAEELKDTLIKLAFTSARNDNRLELNAVLLHIENGEALFLATDGKKLAKISNTIPIEASFKGSYIIPIKAIDEMINILDENGEKAVLNLINDRVCLEYGNQMLMTKLITGLYPDICRVIPQTTNITVPLHREELLTLLRQVALFVSENSISVRFYFNQNKLYLSAACSEIGEGMVSMTCDYNKEPLAIAFNPFYFMEILRHSQDEIIKLSLIDSYNPGVITDSSKALFVMMPMRLEKMQVPHDIEKAYPM